MKSIIRFIIVQFLLIHSLIVFSQITITEIKKSEERIVVKPSSYDSIENWHYREPSLTDNKKYIGLQIYLPPISLNNDIRELGSEHNFLFSTKLTSLKIKQNPGSFHNRGDYDLYGNYIQGQDYDSLLTYIYKPVIKVGDGVILGSDSAEVSNSYYLILNVYFASKVDSIYDFFQNEVKRLQLKYQNKKYLFIPDNWETFWAYRNNIIFLLKEVRSGDSVYCFNKENFILVPYFVKQQLTYKNQYLIYEANSRIDYGDCREEDDIHHNVKKEDDYGNEVVSAKKVKLMKGSKWLCNNITLMKPDYEIHYILQNEKEEEIALTNIDDFILEQAYIQREADKKMQYEQLIAKQKLEELLEKEKERKAIENHKAECISEFGQQTGELIFQGKVKIGMTLLMCQKAWGTPLWKHKTTTENGVYENWYYSLGYSLYFEDGILKIIEE